MKLIDIITAPWAIQEEKYREIIRVYDAHVRGEKIDIAAVEAQLGRPLDNEQNRYEVHDGVAVIPIEGVLGKKMNMFTRISGGSSTQMIGADLRAALDDSQVKAIMFTIDSPGGTVDGTQDLAQMIFASRGTKPMAAFVDGLMASAAAWIGAAADTVYLSGETVTSGSIGVVTTHTDYSEWEKRQGMKTTEIFAGKYKRIVSDVEPLSDEGRQFLQDVVDRMYTVFVNDVAQFRGVSAQEVVERMAEGRVFIGSQGIEAGLADGIITREALAEQLREEAAAHQRSVFIGANYTGGNAVDENTMELTAEMISLDMIERDHPKIAQALIARGRAEGAEQERARIKAVEETLVPGHEALIATLKFDGKTTAADAALAINKAERDRHAQVMATIKEEAPEPVAPSISSQTGVGLTGEEKWQADWAKDSKLKAEFDTYENYAAYMRAAGHGLTGQQKMKRE